MGGGASKGDSDSEKKIKNLEDQLKALKSAGDERDRLKTKTHALEKELDEAKRKNGDLPKAELYAATPMEVAHDTPSREPPPVAPLTSSSDKSGSGKVTVQVVTGRANVASLQKTVPSVEVTWVNASEQYTEVPLNLTGTREDLGQALACLGRPSAAVEIRAPRKPEAKEEAAAAEGAVDDAALTDEELNKKKAEEEAAAKAAEKAPLEKAAFKCESAVEVDPGWDREVALEFEWVDSASPFSEYLDPSGDNWTRAHGAVQQAPDVRPAKVQLEWRQGVGAEWHTVDAPDGRCVVTIQPEELATMNFNGFQSRWRVDGALYLSHLQRAPTLIGKLMKYPIVRTAWRALPPDKRDVDNLPENLQKPISLLEGLIPMNTWDVGYGVTQIPGGFVGGEHVMTLTEKAAHMAKMKMLDPSIQSAVRGEALKAPLSVMNAGLGTLGIKLDFLVKNTDFFIPKMSEVDMAEYEALMADAKEEDFEERRRDAQIDVNTAYPEYQSGVRVALPTAQDLKDALRTKRPRTGATLKVLFKHVFPQSEQHDAEHDVSVTFFPVANPTEKQTLKLSGKEEEEKVGLMGSTMKKVWKEYSGSHAMKEGEYAYYWVIDGKMYYDEGRPIGDDSEGCYSKMLVQMGVRFGVGVKMP